MLYLATQDNNATLLSLISIVRLHHSQFYSTDLQIEEKNLQSYHSRKLHGSGNLNQDVKPTRTSTIHDNKPFAYRDTKIWLPPNTGVDWYETQTTQLPRMHHKSPSTSRRSMEVNLWAWSAFKKSKQLVR